MRPGALFLEGTYIKYVLSVTLTLASDPRFFAKSKDTLLLFVAFPLRILS